MVNQGIFIFTIVSVFLLTVLITKKLIPVLTKLKIGQKILEIGPSWHNSKNGTPTMGGVGFVIAIIFLLLFYALMI